MYGPGMAFYADASSRLKDVINQDEQVQNELKQLHKEHENLRSSCLKSWADLQSCCKEYVKKASDKTGKKMAEAKEKTVKLFESLSKLVPVINERQYKLYTSDLCLIFSKYELIETERCTTVQQMLRKYNECTGALNSVGPAAAQECVALVQRLSIKADVDVFVSEIVNGGPTLMTAVEEDLPMGAQELAACSEAQLQELLNNDTDLLITKRASSMFAAGRASGQSVTSGHAPR